MNNKRIAMISIVVTVISVFYVAWETQPLESTITRSAQYTDLSFERAVEMADVIFVGTVIDEDVKLVREDRYDYHDNGTKYVDRELLYPYRAITVDVQEYLKDTTDQFANPLTILDYPNGLIGEVNGVKKDSDIWIQ